MPSQTRTPTGPTSADTAATNSVRLVSSATMTTSPAAAAPQAARLNVKSIVGMITQVAAPASNHMKRFWLWAATPSARIIPIAASSPSAFQYPSGTDNRYENVGSG